MNDEAHPPPGRCDPFQMAMIHRAFRIEFDNIAALIRAVAPGDTKRGALVGGYLANLSSVLHHHHAAEDDLLWPLLSSRAALRDSDFQRAEAAHRDIAELLDTVESVCPSWIESGAPGLAEQLGTAVDGLRLAATAHFDHEELEIVPLIAEHLTPKEWQAVIDRGAEYVKPSNLWFSLAYGGVLLHNATPEEGRRFTASIPVPLRIVLKLAGGRAFTSYQARLYGQAARQP
jgi:hypothetical protein